MSDRKNSVQAWLTIVVILAIAIRVGLWLTYPLAHSNDTPTYLHLANSIKNHDGFDHYNGTRTPGYPIFLMLAETEPMIYLLQLCMGFLTTLLVFYLGWQMTQRAWLAGLLALTHTLNLGQIFFEATLLSEALATFFIFFVLACLCFILKSPQEPTENKSMRNVLLVALGLGLTAAALAVTRPLFAFVPFWGALFLLFLWKNAPFKLRLGAAMLTAAPALLALLLWVGFIYTQFNLLGLDSIGGYHLVNHTSSFFELAPDEYAPIRDTFLQFRAEHIASAGTPINTIWDAIPTLMTQTKLNYYALGRVMGKISTGLISDHPRLYIQNLVLGWWWFWRVGVFWLPNSISSPVLHNLLIWMMSLERILLFAVNLLFLGISVAVGWQFFYNKVKRDLFFVFGMSAIWVTSILQTLAEHGDNPRFLAPMQTLVILVVVSWVIKTTPIWAKVFAKRT